MIAIVLLYFAIGTIRCFLDRNNILCAIDEVISNGRVLPFHKTWYWFLLVAVFEILLWPYFYWTKKTDEPKHIPNAD